MKTLLTICIGLGAIVAALGIATAIKIIRFANEVIQNTRTQQDKNLNWFGRGLKKIVNKMGC